MSVILLAGMPHFFRCNSVGNSTYSSNRFLGMPNPVRQKEAFATFLGASFEQPSETTHHWCAVAIGDTCLFQTRASSLLFAFPLSHSHEFNNAPWLVGSRIATNEVLNRQALITDGDGQPEDFLWMMTDALAQWCLEAHEMGRNPWLDLEWFVRQTNGNQEFAAWLEGLRNRKQLRNDDVTLLAVQL